MQIYLDQKLLPKKDVKQKLCFGDKKKGKARNLMEKT